MRESESRMAAAKAVANQADERFRLVVEATPNAMLVVSDQGIISMANAQAETTFGYARTELVGQPIDMLMPEYFRGQHATLVDRRVENRQPSARLGANGLLGKRKDGSRVPIEIGLNSINTSQGPFVLALITDITERLRSEREAARQRNELAHLSRVTMLGELSGSLAHELNQPLTAILSNAQAAQRFLASDNPNLEEVRGILNDVVAEDKRAGEIIRRLRLLLKKGEVEYQSLDLNGIIQDVLRFLNSDLLNNMVAARTALEPGLPDVRGDRVQLQQVLVNLIVNGCDAMAGSESSERSLLIRSESANGEGVHLSVVDRGSGIPTERLEGVFDPFYTTKSHGMGLGLAVCRTVVTAHGGRLWATNNPGRGATFHVTLLTANGVTS